MVTFWPFMVKLDVNDTNPDCCFGPCFQFSPTSEHLLLAYGRRHISLLKSVIIDGETTIPMYTILEV